MQRRPIGSIDVVRLVDAGLDLFLRAHGGPQAEQAALARALGVIGLVAAMADRRLGRAFLPNRLHEARPLLAQDALHTADRIALAVEQMADAAQEIDVVGPVIAPAAAALHRADLRESAFPETQDVLRDIEVVGDLADGAKGIGRLFHASPRAFAISAVRSLRNRTCADHTIWTLLFLCLIRGVGIAVDALL